MADKSKKERGCGTCGRRGHKSTSPKCLGDRDPALIKAATPGPTDVPNQDGSGTPVEEVAAVKPTTEEIAAFVAEGEGAAEMQISPAGPPPGPPVITPGPVLADTPYCPKSHAHNWTSSHPAAPGEWVCSDTGKPSRERYEADQARLAATGRVLAADYADGDDAPPPPATWPAPVPDPLTKAIDQSYSRAALATLRQRSMESGTWSPELEQVAWARYSTLAR
jgi:hypothetical protein